jgi:5'-3' exonuclease
MGIPGLFKNIVTKIPQSHFWNKDLKIDFLFLDFNCFIYQAVPVIQKLKTWNFKLKKDNNDFEKALIKYIIEATQELINNIVKPQRLVYIAFDGVPPLVKTLQQKERRTKKIWYQTFEKEYFPETYLENNSWDTNQVIPGTVFMTNLCKEFTKVINKGVFKKIDVIFSGVNVPGEAEHKFLPFIEKIKPNKDDVYCVYSNDADQIILLLRFPDKKFYILHNITETIENKYPDEQKYIYLDVDKFSSEIFNLFDVNKKNVVNNVNNKNKKEKNLNDFLKDYIFLTFLEGNDFVNNIYYLKMKDDHMKTVMSIYKDIRFLRGSRLVRMKDGKLNINYSFMLELLEKLTERESQGFYAYKSKIERVLRFGGRRSNNKDNEDLTMSTMEHTYFYDKKNPLFKDYMKQWNYVFSDLNMSVFKPKYYKHFFGEDYNIDAICKEYFEVLIFNLRYYFGEKIYWRFQYDARVAPIPSDLYQYLLKNPDIFEKLQFKDEEPLPPIMLLMYVLPAQNSDFLPDKVAHLRTKELKEYYPDNIKLDFLTGSKLIYVKPLLKHIPMDKLEKVYNEAKKTLNKAEKERNAVDLAPLVYRGGVSTNNLNVYTH